MCRESQAKTWVVFQAKTQAKMFPIELPPRDIVNVAMCSKRLYDAVRRSQKIWKGQFRSRFPTLLPSLYKDASVADWRERYVQGATG